MPFPSPPSDALLARVVDVCSLHRSDPKALVRSLREEKAAIVKLASANLREERLNRFSVLLKRVERTCNKHFCGLWNEVGPDTRPVRSYSPATTFFPSLILPAVIPSADSSPRFFTLKRGFMRIGMAECASLRFLSVLPCVPLRDCHDISVQCSSGCQFADVPSTWDEEIQLWPALPLRTDSCAEDDLVQQSRWNARAPDMSNRLVALVKDLNARVAAAEARVSTLEVALETANAALAAQSSSHLRLSGSMASLAGEVTTALSRLPPPPPTANPVGITARLQALEGGWLASHASSSPSPLPPVLTVNAGPYVRGPPPSSSELQRMADLQAVEYRWATFQPGVTLQDLMRDGVPPSQPSLTVTTPVSVNRPNLSLRPAPYVRQRPAPSAKELEEMAKNREPAAYTPHSRAFPSHAHTLHEVA